EPPDQHVLGAEAGTYEPAPVPYADTIRRIGEMRDRYARHELDLTWIGRRDRVWLAPPRQHRRDDITAHPYPQRRQRGLHVNGGRVEADLLVRLTQCGGYRISVVRIGATTRERGLTCVIAHIGCSLQQQDVGPVGPVVGEKHEHGAGPAAVVR